MKKSRIVNIFAIVFLINGCATKFLDSYKNPISRNLSTIKEINGEYEIYPLDSASNQKDDFNNAFNKFYRGYGRGVSDTLKLDILNSYSIKLNLRSENKIQIVYLKNGEILKDFELECNLNADSYLYIENNNSKITGIPYLFGGVDIKKIRLTNDNLNNLIIEEVNHSSGGLLLFLGDSKTWNYRNYYKRIW